MDYKHKYLKYKQKYLHLRNQSGGAGEGKRKRYENSILVDIDFINISPRIYEELIKYSEYKNINEKDEEYTERISKLIVIPDSTGPLKFEKKLEFIKSINNEYTMEDLIYCYSQNEVNEKCKKFQDDENNEIPPVQLEKIEDRYNIIDGRHRITAHIIKNIPNIFAIITNASVNSEEDTIAKRKPIIFTPPAHS